MVGVNIHPQEGNYVALFHMNMDMHMSEITDMLFFVSKHLEIYFPKCYELLMNDQLFTLFLVTGIKSSPEQTCSLISENLSLFKLDSY